MITLWIKFCHARLRHRDNIWESERMHAWHARRNLHAGKGQRSKAKG